MKNAMKKLMAFALVAVMLVGMLPFAASAAEVTIAVYRNGTYVDQTTGSSSSYTVEAFRSWAGIDGNITEVDVYDNTGSGEHQYPAVNGSFTIAEGATVVNINFTVEEDNTQTGGDNEGNNGGDEEGTNGGGDEGEEDEDVVETADLAIYVNGKLVHTTYGSPDGNVSVKNCLSVAGVDAAKVTNIYVYNNEGDKQYPSVNGTFTLGSAGSQTNIELTVDTTPDKDDEEDNKDEEVVTEYVEVYVYVDGEKQSSNATKLYKNAELVDDILDDVKSSKWSFLGFKIDNESSMRTNVNVMVEPSQTLKMYFETKESKANSSKVYLHVFMNNDIEEPEKTINITNGIAADGKLDLYTDVKGVIKDYFSAKDSDGIKYDGMYYATGDWAGNYITDSEKYETITNVKQLKEDGYVHLNVMVTNAKLKSSSTADSTNPKTGDNIFMAVSVMTVTASALAVAFYLNKKRAV